MAIAFPTAGAATAPGQYRFAGRATLLAGKRSFQTAFVYPFSEARCELRHNQINV
jgi:hypothetical protein